MPPQTGDSMPGSGEAMVVSGTTEKGTLAGLGATEMLIEGRVYDVASFVKKHPGGRIIKYQFGTDATDTFRAFHDRSGKAKKFLAALPSRPAEVETAPDALVADFRKLRQDLEDEGFFKPNLAHVAMRLAELAAMHVIGVALMFSGLPYLGLVVLGVAQGRCGWLMHEGGHYSMTGAIPVDRVLQSFLYGTGCGMSAAWWRNQHNKHHATPQKIKHDVDLDTLPLIAFNTLVATKGNKLWLKCQAVLFNPVITLLVSLGWQFYLHPRHCLRAGKYIDLAFMALRYGLWAAVSAQLGWGVGTAIGMYCFYVAVGGGYIFTNFAVSHTHKPTVDADQHLNWVLYSANHTTNCSPSWWCDWWMAYLNYQIEHHLFPSMPQYHHPEVSQRVRALFAKHGVTYDCRGYFECMRVTFLNLWDVGHAPV